jgi:DNA mismatch repair protein MutS
MERKLVMSPANDPVTPIRQQYLQIKKRYPHAIVFFRLGDFYETFDDDAHIASRELDVVLTSRNVAKGQRIPMAGVPYHAVESYIAKLIAKGYKVAICEQTGQPIDGLMPREVVRVVTPGTVVEPVLLADKRNNYLATLVLEEGRAGIAYADITTGEFLSTQIEDARIVVAAARELDRLRPAEVVLSDEGEPAAMGSHASAAEAAAAVVAQRYPELVALDVPLTLYEDWRYELGTCRQALLDHFQVTTLAGYGCEDLPQAIRAAGVLVQYLRQHQPSALAQLTRLATYTTSAFMTLDTATRRNLELTETIRERQLRGSLLGVLDMTLTPMGGRLLRRWISQPLLNLSALEERLTAVDTCVQALAQRTALRNLLRGIVDIERLTNRIVQGIALPRELLALKATLERIVDIRTRVKEMVAASSVPIAGDTYPLNGQRFSDCAAACESIGRAIVDEPAATLANGGVIRRGYSPELDAIESSVAEAKRWVASLERVEREHTGIKTLKVGYNKVFGYYLEITHANADAVPEDYIRKQTLVNAERYITPELKEREALILNAADRTQELETMLFRQLLIDIGAHAEELLLTAQALAHLDVYLGLAEVASQYRYVRPELSEDREIDIVAGRHPVVERMLPQNPFVPNDTHLAPEGAIHIITGPNMSGKSTYLRQVALITLMAQIGSFVPASAAHIGLVDRIFARVGAQDEISAGQSTFMVEMVELANILNHATERSLLILDEIGRGTSTYDGISIAWAVVEYLHNHPRLQPKTLFATHYHELTELEGLLPRVRNYNVAVAKEGDHVVFTHHIVAGGADRSYGIYVAQMAGLPGSVTRRAQELLQELETASRRVPTDAGSQPTASVRKKVLEVRQLSLFQTTHPVVDELRKMDILSMSPLEAINKLFELQKKAE